MFCFHKYGPVDSNQYQTCTKCGKVRVAACPHRWDNVKTLDKVSAGRKVGEIWVLRCNRCGEIIQKSIG